MTVRLLSTSTDGAIGGTKTSCIYKCRSLNCDFDTHIDEVSQKPEQEVITTGLLLIQPLLTMKVLFFWTLHLLSSVPNGNEKHIR